MDGFQQQSCVDKLIGKQFIVWIGNDRLQFDRTGGRVDLVVQRQQGAAGQFLFLRPVIGINRKSAAALDFTEKLGKVVLGNRENYRNRLELSNCHQASGVAGMDDVARIDLPQTNTPTDRSGDMAVDQL